MREQLTKPSVATTQVAESGPPLPPAVLRERVGIPESSLSPEEAYLEQGKALRRAIEQCLGPDWDWRSKKVLDFGCGAGRVIRHFFDEASAAEFWGCDIDGPSIEWCQNALSPPMTFFATGEEPPLQAPSDHFDLVYALSVFTHITSHWAPWLMELHRVTAPGGLILATFMGEGMSLRISGEAWNEDRVGMNVYFAGQTWDRGGPMVLHSPWWIREHWGRLFSVELLEDNYFGAGEPGVGQDNHGVVLLRKTDRQAGLDELTRAEPSERRELSALEHEVEHLRAEVALLRRELQK